jgi:hypothetical protein
MTPSLRITLKVVAFALGLNLVSAGRGAAQHGEEKHNMRLLGLNNLQARSAYQPVIQSQGRRWIAYVGHHGGEALNPLTGVVEPNGTSIVEVTDPRNPRYLAHIPGAPGGTEGGGAQMVRVCDGRDLPAADPRKFYMLRTFGNDGHQMWDVTIPSAPVLITTIETGLEGTHKSFWECNTGIAYLVSDGRPFGWRVNRITRVYNLANPEKPAFIRNFGLVGQEPASKVMPIPPGLHGPIALGNRVYIAYGTSANGVMQIVDREQLLTPPFDDTPENLLRPQISRLDMSPNWGGHTSFPVLQIPVPDWQVNRDGRIRDFVVLVSESTANECQEFRHLFFMVDITSEANPFSAANFQVPESSGDFCQRGGRFGSHASNESFNPLYYGRMVFVSWFNAGVRAIDIRDPYAPKEAGFYIPATTKDTDPRDGKIAIQTNNVEVDDRGLIYIVDRANTGIHILELTGEAKRIVPGLR